jgi:TetR/AcrR family transcriptional repressor of nem operon
VRVTKEKKQENHERIVAMASELFRERGFDGVAVAELMERAGLTHGGFYNHFRSKEDLIAEATANGLSATLARYAGHGRGPELRGRSTAG